MKIFEDVQQVEEDLANVVLTVGSFDGIHLGHQRILDEITTTAKRLKGTPAVLTMRPHPRQFLSPDHAPNLLTAEKKKFELLEQAGIEALFILPFNDLTADMDPEDFVRDIVRGRCKSVAVVVGHDCRFGRGARGNFELLKRLGPEYGFEVAQVPPLVINAERVSSTLIRERILQGDLDGVELLLGRKYSILGEVIAGRGMGSKIGFPTANVKPLNSAVPAQGVYVAEVIVDSKPWPSAVNIGIAPTIRHGDETVEAHLIDFSGNLRGEEIEIVFHQRIRPEKKFPSVDALVEQIASDVKSASDYFKKRS